MATPNYEPSRLYPFDPKSRPPAWVPPEFEKENLPAFPAAPVGNGRQTATCCLLYRFYGADKDLLYIGVTTNPRERWTNHEARRWWQLARFVSFQPIAPLGRYRVEQEAIRTEKPRFNRAVYTRSQTVIEFNRGMKEAIEQLRRRMSPEDFAELVALFKAEPDTPSPTH
jgi:predicted GIY-YIG superfamily endonuclease